MALIALAWLLRKNVYPIVGVNSDVRMKEVASVPRIQLSSEEAKYLEEPYRRLPSVMV